MTGVYTWAIPIYSHISYLKIRELLKNKQDISPVLFYNLLENGLNSQCNEGSCLNAALHVWGYFKDKAEEKEKSGFFKYLEKYKLHEAEINKVKSYLKKMAEKYDEKYLLNSYYFIL